jgi:hypothetical protein
MHPEGRSEAMTRKPGYLPRIQSRNSNCGGAMSYSDFLDAISAFFSHPFVLMVGSALVSWRLKVKQKHEK